MSLTESPVRIVNKNLEPGKWRIQVQAGHEVTKVRLLGQRNRWYDLIELTKEDFNSRLMKRPNGEVPDAVILRGVPACYIHDGPWLMLWPSPAHNWKLQYVTAPKVK